MISKKRHLFFFCFLVFVSACTREEKTSEPILELEITFKPGSSGYEIQDEILRVTESFTKSEVVASIQDEKITFKIPTQKKAELKQHLQSILEKVKNQSEVSATVQITENEKDVATLKSVLNDKLSYKIKINMRTVHFVKGAEFSPENLASIGPNVDSNSCVAQVSYSGEQPPMNYRLGFNKLDSSAGAIGRAAEKIFGMMPPSKLKTKIEFDQSTGIPPLESNGYTFNENMFFLATEVLKRNEKPQNRYEDYSTLASSDCHQRLQIAYPQLKFFFQYPGLLSGLADFRFLPE